MKRWTFAFVFIMTLILVLSFTFSASAGSVEALEIIYDVMKKDGNFVFTIGIDDTALSYTDAYLTVAAYDGEKALIDVSMTEVSSEDINNVVYLEENENIAYYTVMLLDGENIAKPLCKPLKQSVSYEDIAYGITFWTDDLYSVDSNKITYYASSTSSVKKTLKVNKSGISFNLNNGYDRSLDYDISELLYLGDDVELKFVENTGDMYFDEIIATQYSHERVYDIDVESTRIKLGNKWLEFDFADDSMEYVLEDNDGKTLSLSDFEIDDVVAVVANDSNYADADYIRLIKLTDNAVTGMVTSTSTQSGKNYVWVNGVKYEDVYGLKNEDEGVFYISMSGKIFDFKSISSKNYAYILEATLTSTDPFSSDVWSLKLLTVRGGVVQYTLTEDASDDFDTYKTEKLGLASSVTKWVWGGTNGATENLDNMYRLITYKTNSNGELKSFACVTYDDCDAIVRVVNRDEYNAKTQKIDSNFIEDDTVIFDVTAAKADSSYVTDSSYLVDGGEYAGLVIKVDGKVKLFLVIEGEVHISDESGFAIVTDKKDTTVDGVDLVIVDYIQDMKEGTVTFNEDSEIIAGTKNISYEYLDIGDIIIFNAASDGIVRTYAVLGQINSNGLLDVYTSTLSIFSEDNEFVYGYIANKDGGNSSKYDVVKVGGNLGIDRVLVSDTTNTYSYFDSGRNIKIKTTYLAEDADWYFNGETDEEDEATFFFARIINGVTSDIYTFNNRIVGLDNINAEAENTVYFDCMTGESIYGSASEGGSGSDSDTDSGDIIDNLDNSGYILEAATITDGFSGDVWVFKLLTANGIKQYTLTEDATEDFENYKTNLGISSSNTSWLWRDNCIDCQNSYRVITYTQNSDGYITSFADVDSFGNASVDIVNIDEYNGTVQLLDGNIIEDDTIIYNVTSSSANLCYSTDISYLVNNGEYSGLICKLDGVSKFLVITDGSVGLSDEKGLAIITEKRDATIDGEDVVYVDYIQDMTEGTVVFNENSEIIVRTEIVFPEDLQIGDVIMFNATSDGIVREYAVLGQINTNGLFDVYTDSLLAFSEDNEFVYGYIASEDGGVSTNYENVEVGGITVYGKTIELSVGRETNTYSYYDAGRNIEIKTQYITEDADWYKEGSTDSKDEATFFFARVIDGMVSDIYTFNCRVIGSVNIEDEAIENAVYVNCATGDVIINEMLDDSGDAEV